MFSCLTNQLLENFDMVKVGNAARIIFDEQIEYLKQTFGRVIQYAMDAVRLVDTLFVAASLH